MSKDKSRTNVPPKIPFSGKSDIDPKTMQPYPAQVNSEDGVVMTMGVAKDKQLVPYIDPLKKVVSDGTTASYYELPPNAKELQDIISFKNMNAQMGEIFRATMRFGEVEHSNKLRDINKIIFYAMEEKKRIEKYGEG